jgi:hypothetical protein
MIIKSHIRGGFRSAAEYLKEQGQNEKTRLVEMSDPHVKDLDEAFRAMWAVADGTKAKKPLHHISINPMKDERLTDEQVRRICERLEEKYGYRPGEHQRVIVEHVKEGRQHFHVIWNRVSLTTGKPHYPYMHKKQSKIAAREMERELGLKKPVSKRSFKAGIPKIKKITAKRSHRTNHRNFGVIEKQLAPARRTRQSGSRSNPRSKLLHYRLSRISTGRKSNQPFRTAFSGTSPTFRSSAFSYWHTHPNKAFRFRAPTPAPTVRFPLPYLPRIRFAIPLDAELPTPSRPSIPSGNLSGMSEAQRIDFAAACAGKISWREYFNKWGNPSFGGMAQP